MCHAHNVMLGNKSIHPRVSMVCAVWADLCPDRGSYSSQTCSSGDWLPQQVIHYHCILAGLLFQISNFITSFALINSSLSTTASTGKSLVLIRKLHMLNHLTLLG